jgi:hypothetical protein
MPKIQHMVLLKFKPEVTPEKIGQGIGGIYKPNTSPKK